MRVVHPVTETKKKLYLSELKAGDVFSAYSGYHSCVRHWMLINYGFYSYKFGIVDLEDGRYCSVDGKEVEVLEIFPNAFVTLGKDSSNADHS